MRIAIIGGGISGLVAGYRLHKDHEVTLFEANDYIGGHTNTIDVFENDRKIPVDTGFIVFNDRTYPNFIELLNELGVESQPTRMSFSVSCAKTGLEYRGADFGGLFAQRKNIVSPKFWRLLLDIIKFNKLGHQLLESDSPNESVGEFFKRHRFSQQFINQYFLPMGAAIWSASFDTFQAFPIQFIAEFYKNHGLLGVTDRPQWRVIKGGSKSYIEPLTRGWFDRIQLNSRVTRIQRGKDFVSICSESKEPRLFDHVIFACHSDQALAILGSSANKTEKEVLAAFPYQKNLAILHTQSSVMPKNKRAWACWNYYNPEHESKAANVTYNMNILQSLKTDNDYLVTLNDHERIDSANTIKSFTYHHPTFGLDRKRMQLRHPELINQNATSFCGAYWGNGFHEDGVKSAIAVTKAIASSVDQQPGSGVVRAQ